MNAQLNQVPSPLDAYHEAARKRDDIIRTSRDLQERIGALQPLHERHAAAKAIFDRITTEEAVALAEWARAGGQGDAPRSDPKALEKAAKALAEAEHGLTAAGVVKGELERELLAVNEQIAGVQAQVRQTLAAVIGDEWLARCEAYAKSAAQLNADRVTLGLLYETMQTAHPGTAVQCANAEQGRQVQRLNDPTINPQDAGTAAFNRWCIETFKDEGIEVAADALRAA